MKVFRFIAITVIIGLLTSPVFGQSGAGGRGRGSASYNVTFESNAPRASLFIDGSEQKGTLPMTVSLEAGRYTVLVRADGYNDWQDTVQITGNQTITANLQPSRFNLTVSANAPGATVFINNSNRGRAPVTEQLRPGRYSVRVTADGYLDFNTSVNLSRDQRLNATLEPERYTLTVTSNVGNAAVYINNSNRGRPTVQEQLRPGRYSIRVSAAGYLDFNTTVNIDRDQRVNAVLQPANATVTIQVPQELIDQDLPGAESMVTVFVDGRPQPSMSFQVSPGRHTIKVRSGGWAVENTYTFSPAGNYVLQPQMAVELMETK